MTPIPPPTADFFIAHLGSPLDSIDPSVFQYAYRPSFELPEHSPIGGVFFERLGFSITMCPPDFYHGDHSLKSASAIVTNVQIYSGDEHFNHDRYTGQLPHGICFEDTHESLIQKLGPSAWTFPFVPPFTLERWDFEEYWIVVVYAKSMASIRMLQVGLKRAAVQSKAPISVLQPDIDTLQELFLKRWTDVAQHPNMQGIDFSSLNHVTETETESHRLDELRTHGVELYFHASQEAASKDERILSSARYFRKGIHFSIGFDGKMPYGLTFATPLELLASAVGSYPLAGQADTLTGHYAWKLPENLLLVSFSVMEQWISRIRVALPPYYEAAYLEKPRLRSPHGA